MAETPEPRPPLPPFDEAGALAKVQAAEDAWNTCDPARVAGAYTPDSVWRNRLEFVSGREEIIAFLTRKWEQELDYALRKSPWGFRGNRSVSGECGEPGPARRRGFRVVGIRERIGKHHGRWRDVVFIERRSPGD